MSEEAFGKKFVGALTHCFRKRLFDASVSDQVSDSGEIFVPRDINGKRSDCKLVVEQPDSKIAGGVMDANLKNENIRNMQTQK